MGRKHQSSWFPVGTNFLIANMQNFLLSTKAAQSDIYRLLIRAPAQILYQ